MGRTARDRTPNLPPVEKIEVPGTIPKWRWVLVVLLLLVGAAFIAYGFSSLFSSEPGWSEIEAESTEDLSCSGDFTLLYNLGTNGMNASAENRALTALYTQAAVDAYRLFTTDIGYVDIHNPYYINAHPNEVMTVDDTLYRAFSQIQQSGDRTLYLAPIYELYDNVFTCADDAQTADFDPRQNEDVRAYDREIASFANDPDAIDIRLLGDGQIELHVSDAYLAYAEEAEIEDFIDFSWLKNAFIIDYLADRLITNGYTAGTISSVDGFSRIMDDDAQHSLTLYDRQGSDIFPAATMIYSGALAIVTLRDYPMDDAYPPRYYTFDDGRTLTRYLDARDGLCKSALHDLTAYSKTSGCAEITLSLIPLFIADEWEDTAPDALCEDGIFTIYCRDRVIRYNDPTLILDHLLNADAIRYISELVTQP